MKVVLVSGSPRKDGNTMDVLAACAEEMRSYGVEAEIVSLAGKSIAGCLACSQCRAKDFNCIVDDGANEIFERISEADGFIAAAPVYYGTARGDMMNFLQRLGRASGQNSYFLRGMVGGPIAVARRGGHTATVQEMLMFYLINGMTVPGSTYWNMVFAREKGEADADEEGMQTIRNFATNTAVIIKKLKS